MSKKDKKSKSKGKSKEDKKAKKAKATKPKASKPKKAKKVEIAIEKPIESVEAPPAEVKEAEPAKPAKKPKPVKKPEPFHFDPPDVKVEAKSVDEGWRGYRLWTTYELDWDDKGDDTSKMKSIRKCIAKFKNALVEDLAKISADDLVIQTDLKKDEHPFEPFIEVWISRKSEAKVREKLVDMSLVSTVDPDYDGEVIEIKEETK